MSEEKHAGGRPSEYRPEFCDLIIEEGKLGKSVTQMAVACNVSKRTLLNWTQEHPEFLHALEIAKSYSLNWWESVAQTHMIEEQGGAKLNQGIWSRSMAARFPEEYTERKQTELTGANGGPIKGLNVTFVDSASE